MASAIHTIPTLFGEEAQYFVNEAESVEANPHSIDFRHEAKVVSDYLKTMSV